jgi:dynein heavy chain
MMNELNKIHSFYKFSLDSFVIVVKRAIDLVAAADKAKKLAAAGGGGDGDAPAEGEEGEAAEGEGDGAEAPAAEEGAAEEKAADGEDPIGQIEEMTPKTLAKRVDDLTESITYQAFNYTRRGTFE